MKKNQNSTDKAIEAVHALYKAVEELYDRELLDITRKSLSIIYLFLARKTAIEVPENSEPHLRIVREDNPMGSPGSS